MISGPLILIASEPPRERSPSRRRAVATGYLRRSGFVRTLNLTIGRFAVEARRVLLRRRRRSRRASAEK